MTDRGGHIELDTRCPVCDSLKYERIYRCYRCNEEGTLEHFQHVMHCRTMPKATTGVKCLECGTIYEG